MNSVANIFIVTTGLTGILNASLELADRLQRAGHTVTLGAPRPVGDKVSAEGLDFVELPFINVDPTAGLNGGGGKLARAWRRWSKRKSRRAAALERYRPHAFRAAVERLQPDLTLIDIELHEYIFAAYALKARFALLSQWYSTWRRPGLPSLLTDVIPGQGERGTPVAINEHWDGLRKKRNRMFARMRLLSFATDRRSVLLALADEYGFPKKYIEENWWPGVFTYSDLPALSMTPVEMEFPHEHRPGLTYIGPMVREGRREAAATSHAGSDLETILAESRQHGRSIILATVSTLHAGDADFLQRLAAAVADNPDWVLIMALGGKLPPERLGALATNVHTFAYVPQLRVMQVAALSINHGGIHTIHEAIHFGVPQLVYSGKRSDQPGCAARVQYHGIGLMADKDEDDVATIRNKIALTLVEDRFRRATGALRQSCANYRRDGVAERAVERLLATTPL